MDADVEGRGGASGDDGTTGDSRACAMVYEGKGTLWSIVTAEGEEVDSVRYTPANRCISTTGRNACAASADERAVSYTALANSDSARMTCLQVSRKRCRRW